MRRRRYLYAVWGTVWVLSVLLSPRAVVLSERIEFRAELKAYRHGMPVDSRARGEVVFRLIEDGSALKYRLSVRSIRDITMSHLHLGGGEHLSTPVVWLYPSSPPPRLIPGVFEGVLAEGKITAADLLGPLKGKSFDILIKEIRAGHTYVNVHTRHHHHFGLRGQVQ